MILTRRNLLVSNEKIRVPIVELEKFLQLFIMLAYHFI